MDIKKYNPHVRRDVDPMILEALSKILKVTSAMHAQYILEAFPALAKEYYPDVFLDKKSNDLGIR